MDTKPLDDPYLILIAFGAIVLIIAIVVAVLYAGRLILVHGVHDTLKIFVPFVMKLLECGFDAIKNIKKPALKVELYLEVWLLLLIVFALLLKVAHSLIPWHTNIIELTVVIFSSLFLFGVLGAVSLAIAVRAR
jgi:NADH:ubiquinone oxidoreductase subunit 3 (subunit A)